MGWEQRGRGRYLYRKKRDGGKVRSVYVGCGPFAEALQKLDRAEMLQASIDREQRRERQAAALASDRNAEEGLQQVLALFRSCMVARGYHQHNRTWRRKRMAKIAPTGGQADQLVKAEADPASDPEACAAWWKRYDDAGAGGAALKVLADRTEAALGEYQDLRKREGIRRKLAELQEQLRSPDDSAIAELLIEQVVLSWLRVAEAERFHSASMQPGAFKGRDVALFAGKMLDRAERRYVQALTALATVRRIPVNLQINIGEKQINLTSGAPTTPALPS